MLGCFIWSITSSFLGLSLFDTSMVKNDPAHPPAKSDPPLPSQTNMQRHALQKFKDLLMKVT